MPERALRVSTITATARAAGPLDLAALAQRARAAPGVWACVTDGFRHGGQVTVRLAAAEAPRAALRVFANGQLSATGLRGAGPPDELAAGFFAGAAGLLGLEIPPGTVRVVLVNADLAAGAPLDRAAFARAARPVALAAWFDPTVCASARARVQAPGGAVTVMAFASGAVLLAGARSLSDARAAADAIAPALRQCALPAACG